MSRSGAGTAGSIVGRAYIPLSRIERPVTDDEARRAFRSKFSGGRCPLCRSPIVKGQPIFYRTGPKPMHLTCPP